VGATIAPFTKPEKPQHSAGIGVDFIGKPYRNSDLVEGHRGEGGAAGSDDSLPHRVPMCHFVEFCAFQSIAKPTCKPDLEKAATR
jgi:hypothetical protein